MNRRVGLWRASLLPRVRKCGRTPIGSAVEIRHGEHGAAFGGLATCGSVWACPCCSARILSHRQDDIRAAVAAHLADPAQGHQLAMLTLTLRHRQPDRLAGLWGAISKAWAAATSGKTWTAEQARYGLAGWVRVLEVTHGRNGWHPHIHVLLFLDRGATGELVTPAELEAWQASIFGRWSRAVDRLGLEPPLPRAQEFHLIQGDGEPLAAYFTKATDTGIAQAVAVEFTRSAAKRSRGETRTPWQILDGVLAGDADDLALWHEYEKASRSRRQITWSRGLRDRLDLSPELTDEEAAEPLETGALCQLLVERDPRTLPDWRRSPPPRTRSICRGCRRACGRGR